MAKDVIKAKVTRAFIDKTDKAKTHKIGDVIEIPKERFDELQKRGIVKVAVIDQSAEVKELQTELEKAYGMTTALKTSLEKANVELETAKAEIVALKTSLEKAKKGKTSEVSE